LYFTNSFYQKKEALATVFRSFYCLQFQGFFLFQGSILLQPLDL